MSHYNGNMFKLKRISLFLLFFIVSLNLFAASKAKKYDYLLKEGSLEEITEAITKDNDFYRMTFGSEKNTILMQALKYNRPYEIIRYIAQSGVKLNARNKHKQDSVMFACAYSNNEKAIKYIIQRSTRPEEIKSRLVSRNGAPNSPLEYAEMNEDGTALKVVNRLLGLEPEEEETENQDTAQKEQPEPELPEETEEDLPPSESINYNKVYLFDYAPAENDAEPEPLPDQDFYAKIDSPDKKDKLDRTPLMLAVKDGNDWEVKSLLSSGAKTNIQDKDGWTAIMYAARYQNNIELLDMLLKNGADPNKRNKYGATALQLAATYSSNPAIVKRLLAEMRGNSNEIFKSFILSITAGGNNHVTQIGKLKVFIENGVPINRFYEGKTPLMYACEFSTSTEVIKLLLENGAIPKIRNGDGKTAYNFAELNIHLEHNEVYWSLNGR
jgi:ankyrin repeat protein